LDVTFTAFYRNIPALSILVAVTFDLPALDVTFTAFYRNIPALSILVAVTFDLPHFMG
jgi:ABC-type amino acid transport system permease subunit